MNRQIAVCLAGAAVVIGGAHWQQWSRIDALEARVELLAQRIAPDGRRAVRGAWPALGMDKTIALGEALKASAANRPAAVTIYCGRTECADLANDLDDAFQIAGWKSDISSASAFGVEEPGIFLAPRSGAAAAVSSALMGIGIQAKLVAGGSDGMLTMIIGGRPK